MGIIFTYSLTGLYVEFFNVNKKIPAMKMYKRDNQKETENVNL